MRFVFFLLFTFSINCAVSAQLPDSIKSYLDSSIAVLRDNSLYTSRVNWPAVTSQVYTAAKSAQTKAQTFTALKIAFDALGDKHAAYYQYDDSYRLENTALVNRYSDSLKAAWQRGPAIITNMLGDIAYIRIPFLGGSKQEDIDRYANWIYDGVAKLQLQHPKGWILDLRLNVGGNIRPMLGGLASFFPDGIASYYIDNKGKALDEAAFSNGAFTIGGEVQAFIKNKNSERINGKVAVLVGPGTASSGEGVAMVFQERKKTRLFGDATAGLANATNGFVFNDNQSYFLISTAYLGNKKKRRLPESIRPDVIVKASENFSDPAKDTIVKTAIQWLRK